MCSDCEASRTCSGHYRLFSPACIHCGARLIQAIGKVGKTAAEITQRRRVVLKDWMAMGHDERELRALAAAKTPALAPATKEPRK